MELSLSPQVEEYINRKVASGQYNSAGEVVSRAVRLMEQSERTRETQLEQLRREIAVGTEQLDRGEYTVYDSRSLHQLADEIKAEGRTKLAEQQKRSTR
jgi:antitoxin ParD1/3/4